MPDIFHTVIDSPVGDLLLVGRDHVLTGIAFHGGGERKGSARPDGPSRGEPFKEVIRQLRAYFTGDLRRFDLQLAPEGTPFQREVWRALQDIPYGETRSYAQMAEAIGRPAAVRAVGAANGRNPIPIIIPCHRVVGSHGDLTGFGGGLKAKQKLLALEGSLTERMFV